MAHGQIVQRDDIHHSVFICLRPPGVRPRNGPLEQRRPTHTRVCSEYAVHVPPVEFMPAGIWAKGHIYRVDPR